MHFSQNHIFTDLCGLKNTHNNIIIFILYIYYDHKPLSEFYVNL